jgi:hypothetical protein
MVKAHEHTEEQVLFAQHLLSMLRKLPRSHVLAFTAGRLLDLLEAIPGGGCSPPVEGSGFGPVLRREYPQGSAPRSSAASAVESTYRARQKLPKGEPRRRIELFLDGREAPQSATDIATATGLALSSVANVLEGGGFERDKTNRMLWRLRAVGAIPLSSPEP